MLTKKHLTTETSGMLRLLDLLKYYISPFPFFTNYGNYNM